MAHGRALIGPRMAVVGILLAFSSRVLAQAAGALVSSFGNDEKRATTYVARLVHRQIFRLRFRLPGGE